MEGHARLAKAGLPLGVGDLGFTHVNEFMRRGIADVLRSVNPTLPTWLAFTGMRKIAEEARKRGKRVIPYGYNSNIEVAPNLVFPLLIGSQSCLSIRPVRLRWEMTEEDLLVEPDGK